MSRTVAIVCGAGVSSTFLARTIREQLAEKSLDWVVEPLAIDQLSDRLGELSLVLVGQHMAASFAEVTQICRARGVSVAQLEGLHHLPAALQAVMIITDTDPSASADARKGNSHG